MYKFLSGSCNCAAAILTFATPPTLPYDVTLFISIKTMRTFWIPTSVLASCTVLQNQLNLPITSNYLGLSYVITCLLNTWPQSLHRGTGATSVHQV